MLHGGGRVRSISSVPWVGCAPGATHIPARVWLPESSLCSALALDVDRRGTYVGASRFSF